MFPILDKTKLKLTAEESPKMAIPIPLKLDVPENVVKGAEIGKIVVRR